MKFKNAAHRGTGFGVFVLFTTLLLSLTGTSAWADYRDQAKRIYDRIAGVPPDDTTITTMADLLDNNNQADAVQAAMIAVEAPEFYSVTLKNFAAPWTNRDQSVFVPLNDYTPRHRHGPGRRRTSGKFCGDIICVGTGHSPPYSRTSNAHYEALERQGSICKADLNCIPNPR